MVGASERTVRISLGPSFFSGDRPQLDLRPRSNYSTHLLRYLMIGATMEIILQNLRYAWRGLRKRPSFAAIAIITLTLGMGVNTAVFSVFYAVLMRPLPYDHPDRLVLVWAGFRTRGMARSAVTGEIGRASCRERVS